jgi:ectoine hydroxylase-related dioxygenase (phytanoyl-CoA dioxygenase family)
MKTHAPTGPTRGYGIVDKTESLSQVTQWAEQIRTIGYVVIDGGFSADELRDFSDRLDRVMDAQVDEFGADRLERIGDGLTARLPLAYDDTFVRLAAHPTVLALSRELVGDYIVLMQQNGVINPPKQQHTQLAYHRDLPYQHFTSSRPLSISVLFCIDPFTSETGATTMIPASHHVAAFPSDAALEAMDTQVIADAGSFIVFDSMLFHRAGVNRSERPRRAVNQMYTIPLIAQQVSVPDACGAKYADDPELSQLFGYEVIPPRSVLEWRERRLSRVAATDG